MTRRLAGALGALLLLVTVLAVGAGPADATRGFHGSLVGRPLHQPIVGIAKHPAGGGYWLVAADGGVFAFGAATFRGSTGGMRLAQPIVGMTSTRSGRGYWLVAADGGVFSFGDARFHGSTGNIRLREPIVGMARTASGRGYWLVARDGGIFAFGDARFYGSTGRIRLAQPIVSMTTTRYGRGYWLLAADGGVFSFGNARFYGSGAGRGSQFSQLLRSPDSRGYLLVATSGGLLRFGNATYRGGAAGMTGIVGAALRYPHSGYWLATSDGAVLTFAPETRRMASGISPGPPSGTPAVVREVFIRLNTERRARGLEPLLWDRALASNASGWSREMARSGFRHSNLGASMAAHGSTYSRMGENIFMGGGHWGDAGSAHTMWMHSSGHRVNIVQPGFTTAGVGAYCSGSNVWLTQEFGAHTAYGHPPYASSAPLAPVTSGSDGGAGC